MRTLSDVARRAGVSPATASRALSGSGPVSRETQACVRAAADELGYVANPVARMLARGSGARIVLAVRDSKPEILADPFVARATASIASVADEAGLGVALRRLPLACASALHDIAADRSVAALVLAGHSSSTLTDLPPSLRGRTAAIGAGADAVPSVDVDSAGGILALLRHLRETGRQRIAMVTGPGWLAATADPMRAYGKFMSDAGLPRRTVTGDFSAARGRSAARRILGTWPDTDAIVTASDAIALGVLDFLTTAGVRVPADIALTGFDDIPLAGPLTTATHPVERIAAAAARAALTGATGRRVFASRPVFRATCGGSVSTV